MAVAQFYIALPIFICISFMGTNTIVAENSKGRESVAVQIESTGKKIGEGVTKAGNVETALSPGTLLQPQTTDNTLSVQNIVQRDYQKGVAVTIADVRSAPNSTSPLVTKAVFGEPVEVLEEQENWLKVRLPQHSSFEGWIKKWQVKNYSTQYKNDDRVVIVPKIKVYTQASTSSSAVRNLLIGSKVTAINPGKIHGNGFIEVQLFEGTKGFVKANALLPYDRIRFAPPLPQGKERVEPHVEKVADEVRQKFPGILNILGRQEMIVAGDHPDGLAIDLMVKPHSKEGHEIAVWIMNNYQRLGVKYIIWGQRIWNPSRDGAPKPWSQWRKMEDRGSIHENHWDHPHVSFKDA